MEINYKITETSKSNIEKFPWIKSNLALGALGARSDREIVRLLENTHYENIVKTLEQINKYGDLSEEIGESILACNDSLVFSRLLAELSLFVYLYDKLNSKVSPIRRIHNQKSPDISVKFDEYEYRIEIYSPMDFYGYQVFSGLLTSSLKNLDIDIGYKISIDSEAENFAYTYDFPQFRDVYDWFDGFIKNFTGWIKSAKEGSFYFSDSPAGTVKLKVLVNSIETDPKIRTISWEQATRSTDTIWYFRIGDSDKFAETEWGLKIKDKLQRQQAGESLDKVVRILAINLALAETSDLSFLNNSQYITNFEKHIKHLASDIKPYPPYDVVLACKLDFECGFAKPINLSDFKDEFIEESMAKIHMDEPIKEIQVATKEQIKELWDFINNASDD